MIVFYAISTVMKEFSTFNFDWYNRDSETLKARFFYSFDQDVRFTEEVDFSCEGFSVHKPIDQKVMESLLAHLSLALGISYYKLYPMAHLVVHHWTLNDDQLSFWTSFYTHWLWEYFFKNKVSPKNIIKFSSHGEALSSSPFSLITNQTMVAIWWGKDSLVSIELIKKIWMPFYTSTFWKDYLLHKSVGDVVGAPRLVMKRTMDPLLFTMNAEWYYNGHVPISWIIAFVLVTAAYLYDYQYIVMSNEKSADEWNTLLDGIIINHQWSKSLSFEQEFSRYLATYLSPTVRYFSLLRGMYEIAIAKQFAQYPQYFAFFSSCNNNFKIIESNKRTDSRWCCVCPKCAFVYAMLRPFLDDTTMFSIFGKNLYDDLSLESLFRELLWISWIKPFECVWTNEEVILAMYLYYRQIKWNSEIPYIILLFEKEVLPLMTSSDFDVLQKKLFTTYNEWNIPSVFLPALAI